MSAFPQVIDFDETLCHCVDLHELPPSTSLMPVAMEHLFQVEPDLAALLIGYIRVEEGKDVLPTFPLSSWSDKEGELRRLDLMDLSPAARLAISTSLASSGGRGTIGQVPRYLKDAMKMMCPGAITSRFEAVYMRDATFLMRWTIADGLNDIDGTRVTGERHMSELMESVRGQVFISGAGAAHDRLLRTVRVERDLARFDALFEIMTEVSMKTSPFPGTVKVAQ